MNSLRYNKPAKFWEEALPLGNGRIGAMIYGGVAQERIELNEDTIWAGRPSSEDGYGIKENIDSVRQLLRDGKYCEADARTDQMLGKHDVQSYQMAGNLYLNFDVSDEVDSYERSLDLSTATVTSRHKQNDIRFTRESFISAPHQVMALRIKADKPGSVSFTLTADSQIHHEIQTNARDLTLTGTCPLRNSARSMDAVVWEEDARTGMRYVTKARIINTAGTVTADDSGLKVEGANEAIILVAIRTGFSEWNKEPADDTVAMETGCDDLLTAAEEAGWDLLSSAHQKDYASIYSRMSLDLEATDDRPTDEILINACDPAESTALANLVFNYGRYLLISCSRRGTQPANLQGVWNDKFLAPWCSDFHTNINLEMNYWPAETCNLADCAEPLLEFVKDMAVSGQRPAKELYSARGWCMHHVSDIWRYPYTGGSKAQHAFWPVASAWLCQHLWEHYAFSADRGYLAAAIPVMKGAAAFFLDFMVENSEGNLVTSPSTSPENRFIDPSTGEQSSVCEGSAMDMTMIRELFENIIEGSALLGESDALLAEITAANARLAMPKIGKDGCMLEFGIEAEQPQPGHRHISHLYGVYPGWMFTPDRLPEYYEACRKSLDARGDKSTGWAMGWRVAMWARLLDGNRALGVIGNLLTYKDADPDGEKKPGGGLYANLWDAHPPFQIDGNFGVTAGIAEMILQSHQVANGKRVISLLPALPDAWQSGSVSGMRARGAMEVALRWKDSQITELSITAQQDTSFELRYNGKTQDVSIKAGETFEL